EEEGARAVWGSFHARPVVPSWVPDREATVDLRIEDQTGDRLIEIRSNLDSPVLTGRLVAAGVGVGAARLRGERERDLRVRAGLGDDQLARPRAREGPPRHVEQEALSEAVVAGDEVQPGREVHLHLGRRPDVLEVNGLEHGQNSKPFL